jgi:hypothetical protein
VVSGGWRIRGVQGGCGAAEVVAISFEATAKSVSLPFDKLIDGAEQSPEGSSSMAKRV